MEDTTKLGTRYQWYRDDTSHLIPGADSLTYAVTTEDVGHNLIFGVTPYSQTGVPHIGAEESSAPLLVRAVTRLEFKQSSQVQDVGKSIVFDMTALGPSGEPVPRVPVHIRTVGEVADQQGRPRSDSGALIINGTEIGPMSKRFYTDDNGHLIANVTDPHGIGVVHKLTVDVGQITKTPYVIFTAPTSPDNGAAWMYGHAAESIQVGGVGSVAPGSCMNLASPANRPSRDITTRTTSHGHCSHSRRPCAPPHHWTPCALRKPAGRSRRRGGRPGAATTSHRRRSLAVRSRPGFTGSIWHPERMTCGRSARRDGICNQSA